MRRKGSDPSGHSRDERPRDGMPFEIRQEAAVAAHAAVAGAGMTANVLERLDILRGKRFGQDSFRDAQAMADVAQAAVGGASVRVTAAVHDRSRGSILRINLNNMISLVQAMSSRLSVYGPSRGLCKKGRR